jgi:putative membrane protein
MMTCTFAFADADLGTLLGHSALFGMTGIVLAIAGFKIFDLLTPGNLQKEIFENRNMAAAVLASAFIIGICIIVAAAVG